MRYYTAIVGAHEVSFWAESNDRALRVIRRWIGLFWRRYVDGLPNTWSIAYHAATVDPICELRIHAVPDGYTVEDQIVSFATSEVVRFPIGSRA